MIGALKRAAAEPAAQRRPPSLYRHVDDRIRKLMPLLGVERSTAQIREAFAILCRESLAPPDDGHVARASRLNADGTPVQFALTVGPSAPLQFLSEPAGPGASNVERLQAARDRIDGLSALFGIADVAASTPGWTAPHPWTIPTLRPTMRGRFGWARHSPARGRPSSRSTSTRSGAGPAIAGRGWGCWPTMSAPPPNGAPFGRC